MPLIVKWCFPVNWSCVVHLHMGDLGLRMHHTPIYQSVSVSVLIARGFGESEAPTETSAYKMANGISDVTALLDELKVDK